MDKFMNDFFSDKIYLETLDEDYKKDIRKNFFKGENYPGLHSDAMYGTKKSIILRLKKGENVNEKTEFGYTPLHLACCHCDNFPMKCIDGIFKLYDIDLEYEKKDECVKLLLENGAMINEKDNYGRTPLHISARYNIGECTKILLENGALINEKDNDEFTPLHYAVLCGHISCVKLLVEKGALVHEKNKYGKTPLDLFDTQKLLENVNTEEELIFFDKFISEKL